MDLQDFMNNVYIGNNNDAEVSSGNEPVHESVDTENTTEDHADGQDTLVVPANVPSFDVKALKLQMLGYYNTEVQILKEEQIYPDEARELAALLCESFKGLDTLAPKNYEVRAALEAYRGTGVFIFRDANYNLYAYWPHQQIARISHVSYYKENISRVPYSFRIWFTPGEILTFKTTAKEQLSFFEYIHDRISVGEQVSLSIGGEYEAGKLKEVGADFIVLSTKKGDLIASRSMAIRTIASNAIAPTEEQNEEDDSSLQPDGYITETSIDGGKVFDYRTQETFPFKFYLNQHLKDNDIRKNDLVVFKIVSDKNGRKSAKSICPVNIDDACRICKRCSGSTDWFLSATAKYISKKLRSEFPDDERVKSLQDKKINERDSELNKVKTEADSLRNEGRYAEAEKLYLSFLDKDKRILTDLCSLYVKMYRECEFEEKERVSGIILGFIHQHDELLSNENTSFRKYLLLAIGRRDLFEGFIDKNLSSCESNNNRAILLKHKAFLVSDTDKALYQNYLSESLAANPWDKNVEKLLNALLGYNSDEDRTFSVPVLLDEESISNDVFLSSLFCNYSNVNGSQYNKTTLEEQTDRSRINTSDFNNYTLRLLYYYKASSQAALPGKTLSLYCSSKALALARENGDLHSIRYLLIKSLTYVGGFGYFVRRNLYIYILSCMVETGDELYAKIPLASKVLKFDEILQRLMDSYPDGWLDILSEVMMVNARVCHYIKEWCWENPSLNKASTAIFCTKYSHIASNDKNDFSAIWDRHIEIRQKQEEKDKDLQQLDIASVNDYIVRIKSIPQGSLSDNEKSIIKGFTDILENTIKMRQTQDILSKQRRALDIIASATALSDQIRAIPTRLLCSLVPAIHVLTKQVDMNYQQTKNSFNNKISINPLSYNVPILKKSGKHVATVLLEITNEEGGLSVSDISLTVSRKKQDEEPAFERDYEYSINSGNSWECPCEIELNQEEIGNKYIELFINLSYYAETAAKTHELKEKLKINLYPKEDFSPIPNPYNPTSGKPLQSENENMFFGRTDLLNELEAAFREPGSYRHFIIYGQKRSGKSSLLNILEKRLSSCDDLLIVKVNLQASKISDDFDFYRVIINGIIDKLHIGTDQGIGIDDLKDIRKKYTSIEFFQKYFKQLRQNEQWGNKRLLLMIDEFTVLYNGIKAGDVKESILRDWKYLAEDSSTQFGAILSGHDITPIFLAEDYNRNAAAILEQRQMTYLGKMDAERLIKEPVMDGNQSRYVGRSVSRILEYTARSPYYLQIFCNHLINYVNKKCSYRITLTDVEAVAQMLYCYSEDDVSLTFSTIASWDNLINNGLHSKWNKDSDEDIERILRTIAKETSKDNATLCSRDAIRLDADNYPGLSEEDLFKKEERILNDLCMRNVLDCKNFNDLSHYKIRVLLFQKWLINHPQ